MSYGFRVYGASGQKQVDENSILYVEHSRGSVAFTAASAFDGHRKAAIGLPEPSALVAVRIRDGIPGGAGYNAYSFSYLTGSEFRAFCFFTAGGAYGASPTLEYIIYTRAVQAETGYGLNIYDASGAVAFSSNTSNKYCSFLAMQDYFENQNDVFFPSGLTDSASDWLIVPHCVPFNVQITFSGSGTAVWRTWQSAFVRATSGVLRRYWSTFQVGGFNNSIPYFTDSGPNFLFPNAVWNNINYTVGFGRQHIIRVSG